MGPISRRGMIQATALGTLGASLAPDQRVAAPTLSSAPEPRLFLSVKYGMVRTKGSMSDRFKLLKALGYDGVELDSPASYDLGEVLAAREASGLPVHGVVNSAHWRVRLSDPAEATRKKAVETLAQAIRDAKAFGGSSVLLVPGKVGKDGNETPQQVWDRSIAGIREVLPLAAREGIHILIENVWNGFCYVHGGHEWQGGERFAAYIDAINSPWVGLYHDLGNHQKYGAVPDWIRCFGSRIVKLDIKDWGKKAGWCKIGDGDVDWSGVRSALKEIGFNGWCTAEVGGGGEERLADIKRRMDAVLLGR